MTISIIPLHLATFCESCQMVTDSRNQCVACGSFAVVNLSRLLAGDFSPLPMELPSLIQALPKEN